MPEHPPGLSLVARVCGGRQRTWKIQCQECQLLPRFFLCRSFLTRRVLGFSCDLYQVRCTLKCQCMPACPCTERLACKCTFISMSIDDGRDLKRRSHSMKQGNRNSEWKCTSAQIVLYDPSGRGVRVLRFHKAHARPCGVVECNQDPVGYLLTMTSLP